MTPFDWTFAALLYAGLGNAIYCPRYLITRKWRPNYGRPVHITVYVLVVASWPAILLNRLFTCVQPRAKEAHPDDVKNQPLPARTARRATPRKRQAQAHG